MAIANCALEPANADVIISQQVLPSLCVVCARSPFGQGAISGLMMALSVADASQYAAGALAHLSHHSLHNQELIGKEPGIMQRIASLLGDGDAGALHYCVLALANLGCASANQEKMAATPGLVAQVSSTRLEVCFNK
jgi:hypothetical protein